ncbi:MAG: pitrilysin family protein [Phycisphaerae bacterium]|jgi:predicted Zn-dependent peptidase
MSSTFVQHDLPNGLRVICEVMPRVRSGAVAFLARTGARHEQPHLHGVSHFLEHMCFKGTPRRGWHEINTRFDDLGAIYNAYTGKEHTVYYGWVPAERLTDQLELLADMMRPSLPADEFETERKVILEEIAMSDDQFERHVSDFLHTTVFGRHPLGHEILGEKETIAALPHEALVDYHRRRYAPGNMVVFATGPREPEEIFAAVGRHCGAWNGAVDGQLPAEPLPELPTGVRKLQLERFKQQSLVLVYPSVPAGHEDEEAVEAFVSLFGGSNSRCYWNIVQKGICTHAGAVWLGYAGAGVMALYADGEPHRCEEMLAALRAQAQEVQRNGFRRDEVQRVRNRRRTLLAIEAESPRTRVMQLIDDFDSRGHVRTVDARLAAVEAVSEKTIARHLARYPIDGEGLLLSCGPRDWP